MFRTLIILIFAILNHSTKPQSNQSFSNIVDNFIVEYEQLNIPNLELSYNHNLNAIDSLKDLERQEAFFLEYNSQLKSLNAQNLTKKEQVTKAVLDYEIQLNLERISLEKQWKTENYTIKGSKLYEEDLGKQWYAYFLKKWIDQSLTPDATFQFGLTEIEKVKSAIVQIQNEMGLTQSEFDKHIEDEVFFMQDKKEILEKYNQLSTIVEQKAKDYFPNVDQVPQVNIRAGTDRALAMAPAYYYNDTFFYNFFEENYDVRDMGWLYVHEAIPGHHYQNHMTSLYNLPITPLFGYMGYIEGWAAYIEQFGPELHAYKNSMDSYAQLRWDLIRSIRVALDVGLNYYGWSDDKALEFWKQHLSGKDDIAIREIKRMKRWPVQVITYKYGKNILDKLKGDITSPAELKRFHQKVLQYGPIPLSVLETHI